MNRMLVVIALAVLSLLRARGAGAQEARAAATEQTYFDFQVDQTVSIKSNRNPAYPERFRGMNIEGQVIVQFVVDEGGNAEMSTFKVLKTTDNEFVESVRRAVGATVYNAAEFHGRKVKQLVQQPFRFSPR